MTEQRETDVVRAVALDVVEDLRTGARAFVSLRAHKSSSGATLRRAFALLLDGMNAPIEFDRRANTWSLTDKAWRIPPEHWTRLALVAELEQQYREHELEAAAQLAEDTAAWEAERFAGLGDLGAKR